MSRDATPRAVPIGRMSPFTALSREQRTLNATAPRPAHSGTDWMIDGACNDEDPALFQPIGESSVFAGQIEQARAVCRSCPVAGLCREFALETRQSAGIWAAMTERDREQELRRRARRRQQDARRDAA